MLFLCLLVAIFAKKLFSSFFVSSCQVNTLNGSQPMTMRTAPKLYINLTNRKDRTMGQHCSANGIIPFMPNHFTSESNRYSSEQERAGSIAIKCTTFSRVLSEGRNLFILQGKKKSSSHTTAFTIQQCPSDYINILLYNATTHRSTI